MGRRSASVSGRRGRTPGAISCSSTVCASTPADTRLQLTKATARLGAFGFDAQDRVKASLDDLRTPTLVVHGADDPLVPATATETLGWLPGVTRKLYPTLRHETLFEPEGPEVAADIIAWLREATEAST